MEKILLAGIVLCGFMLLMSLIDGSDSSGEDTRTGGPSGCGWLMILAIIGAVLFFSGCGVSGYTYDATADPRFAMNDADRDAVASVTAGDHIGITVACAKIIGTNPFYSNYLGCWWEQAKTIFIADDGPCVERTWDHEKAHALSGLSSKEVHSMFDKRECDYERNKQFKRRR